MGWKSDSKNTLPLKSSPLVFGLGAWGKGEGVWGDKVMIFIRVACICDSRNKKPNVYFWGGLF